MRNPLSSFGSILSSSLPDGARILRELAEGEPFEIGCAYLDFASAMQPDLLVCRSFRNGQYRFDIYDRISGHKNGSLTTDALTAPIYLVELPDGFLKDPVDNGEFFCSGTPFGLRDGINKLLAKRGKTS